MVCQGAAHVIPPTQQIAEHMIKVVPDTASRLTVIPNFVDTEMFRPMPQEKVYDLVYVGRLSGSQESATPYWKRLSNWM